MESHGAALKEIQATYDPQGLFVCGLARAEHPYDVEDYVRHFRVPFPIYVDLNEDSSPECCAGLDSVAVLDANHKPSAPGGRLTDPCKLGRCWTSSLAKRSGTGKAQRAQHGQPRCGRLALVAAYHAARLEPTGSARPGQVPASGRLRDQPGALRLGSGEVRRSASSSRCSTGRTGRRRDPFRQGRMPTPRRWMWTLKANLPWPGRRRRPGVYGCFLAPLQAPSEPAGGYFPGRHRCLPAGCLLPGRRRNRRRVVWLEARATPRLSQLVVAIDLCDHPGGGAPGPIHELAKLERGSDDCWDPITGAPGELQVSWLRDENPPRLFCSARGADGWSAPEALLPMKTGWANFWFIADFRGTPMMLRRLVPAPPPVTSGTTTGPATAQVGGGPVALR